MQVRFFCLQIGLVLNRLLVTRFILALVDWLLVIRVLKCQRTRPRQLLLFLLGSKGRILMEIVRALIRLNHRSFLSTSTGGILMNLLQVVVEVDVSLARGQRRPV